MIRTIRCPKCGTKIEVDDEKVTENYVQCPFPLCGYIFINPLKEEKNHL
jgi:uncharacterized Zn finger protein